MQADMKPSEGYFQFKTKIIWSNLIGIIILYIATIYTYIFLVPQLKFSTTFFVWMCGILGGLGTTVGTHRLWTHKTYKAKTALRIILMLCYTTSGQYSIVQWARDHRTHHKFTDTNADPHNASRGFWFSHVGWLVMKRHPDVKEKGKLIDVSDLLEDPVIRFHQKYFIPLLIVFHMILPSALCYYWLEESLFVSIVGGYLARCGTTYNSIWSINSVSHLWGSRPYNKKIKATQNKIAAFFTLGESWHNFHHVFPWDYRIGEFGNGFQVGTYVIQACEWLGLAYDLKFAPDSLIKKVMERSEKDPCYEAPDPLLPTNGCNHEILKNAYKES